LLKTYTNLHETWHVHHGAWANLNGALHNYFPSVIPTLQPFNLLRENLNIAWTPLPIFIQLDMYSMPHECTSTAYIINPSHQKYQHCSLSYFWDMTLILLEHLY
jgi:hypothetical protein